MPITQKIAAALLLMFLTLLLGAAIVLDRAVRPGFEQLEADAHERSLTRVSEVLNAIREDVRGRALDYATWDDTYAYVSGRNPGYTRDLSEEWFNDYGVDFVAFVGADNRVLWNRRRNGEDAPISDDVYAGRILAEIPRATHPGQPVFGAVYSESGLLLLTAMPATRTGGGGDPRGLVIMGRRLSGQDLAQQAQLSVEIIDAANAPQDLATRLAGEPMQSWRTRDELNGLFTLRTFNGEIVAGVLTRQPRDISALGAQTAALALALFAAICAAALGALWFMLRAGVIQRLQRLEQHFHAQTASLPEPLPIHDARPDEITRLTASYNALAARLRETTAREQAAELQREAEAAANRMKSDFLANVSHELRTPLNAVIGYAELIKEELNEQGITGADDDLARIVKSARRLLVMVNEILDLSKIEVGRLEMKLESFKVDEMLQRALGAVQPLAASEDVHLVLTTDGDLGAAYSDEFRLRQCLINVLASSCKFASNGTVSLHAARVDTPLDEHLRFEIRDTGPGLTPDQLTYAFEPFQRAGASVAATIGGASLGLAMTRKLLTLLGGKIEAASPAGEGAVFVIIAPAVTEDAVTASHHILAA